MLLKDILNDLINNELGNLPIGKPEWSTGKFNYKVLIQCISLGYQELHKRFSLKKENIIIQPIEGLNEYVLSSEHAITNSASTQPKYIIDTIGRPFKNNVAKIDTIFDSLGEEVTFNTTSLNDEFYVTDYRTLFIKNPKNDASFRLVCRVIPEPIKLATEMELDTYDIDLPYSFLEALLCYAAGRVYINRGAENATNNESSIFFARFEQACANIVQLGLNTTEIASNRRLELRGFV